MHEQNIEACVSTDLLGINPLLIMGLVTCMQKKIAVINVSNINSQVITLILILGSKKLRLNFTISNESTCNGNDIFSSVYLLALLLHCIHCCKRLTIPFIIRVASH